MKTAIQQSLIEKIKKEREKMKDIHKNYGEQEFARGYIVALNDVISIIENFKDS